jgi:hypothetical protein
LISDNIPNPVGIQTNDPLEIDILDDYELDDVLGLLNGGLKIRRELDQITDDRLTINITLPENLVFIGEDPLSEDQGRTKYVYSGGYKMVGSAIAPKYSDEKVDLDAVIDLSQVNSHYISDMEIEITMEATVAMQRIEFDPNDYEVNTDLDYELDYLTSDLVRILDRMGIVDRSEIEEKVREEVLDLIEELMDDEGQEIEIILDESSMVFDEDLIHVDDQDPIRISVDAKGAIKPLAEVDGSEEAIGKTNRFLPPHIDPIIPARTLTKTIDIRGIRDWDPNIRIVFPSGSGVKAWFGEGSNDKMSMLKVVVEDGYPTLLVTPEDGEGDKITLEFTVGGYFAYNNVTACFCSATGVVLLVILFIVLLIIRGIVRRRKEKKEGGEDGGKEDGGEEEVKNDDKELKRKTGEKGEEETLSW